ncbi:54S ribosomal protein L19, mitochondrial [Smittium culicis]|uniref:Large ribosomal subunit protein uL11m n=1 Tax=Smittium culicis TaxID=133412 RepID=A0A1R1XYV0_9FUNG|nr:54S ribosomal protein L19, mitochondrial [Smittium culicis]
MSKKPSSSASILKLLVPAQKATPSPPIGPALGQRGIKSIDFCKKFNEITNNIQPLTPIPTIISIKSDRTFSFITKSPPTSYLLKRSCGVEKGAQKPGSEVVGTVSVKHIYEIAKIKQMDVGLQHVPLENICKSIIGSAKSIGINVKY